MPQRFFVSELIRETVFELFKEEIPYSTEVTISEFKEREKGKWYIAADIIIEKESQKAILIGEKGSKIKQIGLLSRDKVEEHLEFPVFLELFVKVREDWRSKTTYLRSFGY
jgi:GTP-binding protein Era